jgi:transcriptional regulator with PAS, ATPase and Fis domain
MSNSNEISAENLNLSPSDEVSETLTTEMTMKEYELKIIKNYLLKYDGNMKLVAQKLDIGLSTLYRILKEDADNS